MPNPPGRTRRDYPQENQYELAQSSKIFYLMEGIVKHYRDVTLISLLVTFFIAFTVIPAFPQKQTVAVLDLKGDSSLVSLAREEIEAHMKAKGFRTVVATSSFNQDLGNLERELELGHSKYAQKGENHPDTGYFRGANLAILGTVEYSIQDKAYAPADLLARVAGLNTNYKVLTVEVKIQLVDLKTREQLAHGLGSADVKYSDNANSIASRKSYSKARREASIQAAQMAIRQLMANLPVAKPIK